MKTSKKHIKNVRTSLLSPAENEHVFQLLGHDCVSKSTTIVQLYKTKPPHHNQWFKQHSGVLCFVNDKSIKRYVFRLYCMDNNTLLWDFCIPQGFEYKRSTPYLYEFCGPDCIFGINFADEDEATDFHKTVMALVKPMKVQKQSKSEEKKMKKQNEISRKKSQKPVISNPVCFKHVQHYGFDEWRELNTEIDKLSNKVQDHSAPSAPLVNGTQIVQQIETETSTSTIPPPRPPQESTDYVEQNTMMSEKSQFNMLSELNLKLGSNQKINCIPKQNEEYANTEQTRGSTHQEHVYEHVQNFVSQETGQLLKQALTSRHCAYQKSDSDFSDDDDDDWD